jgi:hypothetical protein
VREAAKKDSKQKFTALLHHVSIDLLRDSYYSLKKEAAPGADVRDGLADEPKGTVVTCGMSKGCRDLTRGGHRAEG